VPRIVARMPFRTAPVKAWPLVRRCLNEAVLNALYVKDQNRAGGVLRGLRASLSRPSSNWEAESGPGWTMCKPHSSLAGPPESSCIGSDIPKAPTYRRQRQRSAGRSPSSQCRHTVGHVPITSCVRSSASALLGPPGSRPVRFHRVGSSLEVSSARAGSSSRRR
jgi:hypothetical protein